jgi:hypothetical protein
MFLNFMPHYFVYLFRIVVYIIKTIKSYQNEKNIVSLSRNDWALVKWLY